MSFLLPREDEYSLSEVKRNLKTNNKLKTKRKNALLSFIQEKDRCRNIVLAEYFGEKLEKPCGHCDICKKKTKPKNYHLLLQQRLLDHLESTPKTIHELKQAYIDDGIPEMTKALRTLLRTEK